MNDSYHLKTVTESQNPTKSRLKRHERYQQLIDVAWQIVAAEGTNALTMGKLAQIALVAKPVVYDHFESRSGLLAALWQDCISKQQERIHHNLALGTGDLEERVQIIINSYIDCILYETTHMPQIVAALSGSDELYQLKKTCYTDFIEQCRNLLQPFLGDKGISNVVGTVLIGAASALAEYVSENNSYADDAKSELKQLLLWAVQRSY